MYCKTEMEVSRKLDNRYYISRIYQNKSKVIVPKTTKIQDKVVPVPNYAIPQIKSNDDSGSRMVERKAIHDVNREIPVHTDPVYRPPPKPVKTPISEILGNLLDIDPELNTDFEENSPFQEGVISEMYQRLDKSHFQEPQELECLINTGRLVQRFLLKQADIDNILKIIQKEKFSKNAFTCYC